MFKSQMKFQKILCFVCLILAAVLFVYSLGFVTSIYNMLNYTWRVNKNSGTMTLRDPELEGTGCELFWELETLVMPETKLVTDANGNEEEVTVENRTVGFVDKLMGVAIADIAAAVILFVFNTHKRRKYYIGNYVATGIFAGYNFAAAIWMLIKLVEYHHKFLAMDHEAIKAFCEQWAMDYNYKGAIISFDLGYVLGALMIVAALAIALNLVWKLLLQKRENKLLTQAPVQEVAING